MTEGAGGTVVVCDVLRAVAEALAGYLEDAPDLTVVGAVTSAGELLDVVAARRPALAVLDSAVPRTADKSLAAEVRAASPGCRVLMTGSDSASDEAVEALRDGAMGWIPGGASAPEMLDAVRGILRGEYRIPSELLVNALQAFAQGGGPGEPVTTVRDDPRLAVLGDRELAVLACLVGGLDRRDIASRLGIAENTVRTHIGRILGKLDAHSMLEAAAIGRRAGLVGLDE